MGCVNTRPIKHPKKPLPTIPGQVGENGVNTVGTLATGNNATPSGGAVYQNNSGSGGGGGGVGDPKSKKKSLFATLRTTSKTDRSGSDVSSMYSSDGVIQTRVPQVNGIVPSSPAKQHAPPQRSPTNASLPTLNKEKKIVIALYPYESRDEGELSFEKNEKLVIVDDSEPDWWIAYKLTAPDKKGFIPMNFTVSNVIETEE